MECPHCGQETSPTYLYCEKCGQQLELNLEAVRKSMERDELADAMEMAERETRIALYLTAFFLACVIGLRIVAVRPVVADSFAGFQLPFKAIEEKGLEPPATLEVKPIPLDIPKD